MNIQQSQRDQTGCNLDGLNSVQADRTAAARPSAVEITANIRDLKPGQVFTGQITDIRDGMVTILSSGQNIQARFESTVNICMGEVIRFAVKSSQGEKVLIAPVKGETLTPEDMTMYKALDAAGLPATDKNIDVISELLRNNMSVDLKSIQQILSYTFQFPEADIRDLVMLQKHEIPVTMGNLEQLNACEEGKQSLTGDIKVLASGFPEVISRILDTEGLEGVKQFLKDINLGQTGPVLSEAVRELAEESSTDRAAGLMKDTAFGSALSEGILKHLTLLPGNVDAAGVNLLYNRLRQAADSIEERQENRQQQGYEPSARDNSGLSSAVHNLRNNLEFIKDINQQFIYAQLPIQLKDQITHGDLYVFENKRKSRSAEEGVKVLLHLDLQYLGSTDIMIYLKGKRLDIKFTASDRHGADLLGRYGNELERKLELMGYAVHPSYEKAVPEEAFRFKEDFIEQDEPEKGKISRYSFDMRI